MIALLFESVNLYKKYVQKVRCKTIETEKDFFKVLKYIDASIWKDETPLDVVQKVATNYVESLPKISKQEKVLHRICGQSGSGKTTQVLQSLNNALNENQQKFYHLAVRNFSSFHPKYEDLLKQHGKKHIREKTNGFALKCLVFALKILLNRGAPVVLEITLLEKIFEKLILLLAKENDYKVKFHILAISPKISNDFTIQRNSGLAEEERLTYQKSLNYFNKILPVSFRYLTKQNILQCEVVMWNAFDLMPCFIGKLKNAREAFKKERKKVEDFIFSSEELLQAKIEYYQSALKD